MKEQWKEVPGFKNYKVSSMGRVASNGRWNPIMRKLALRKDGYQVLTIRDENGKRVQKKVHRIVAEAFIPNTSNYPFVNHIDNNRANNLVENLEWCTPKMNAIHSVKCGRHPRGSGTSYAKIDEITALAILTIVGHPYWTHAKIACSLNYNLGSISMIRNGKAWAHVKSSITPQ